MLDRYIRLSYNYQSKKGYDSLIQNVILREIINIIGTTITGYRIPIILLQVQKSFPLLLSKKFCPLLLRIYKKSGKHKKSLRGNIRKRRSNFACKMNNLEAKKENSAARRMLTTHKIHYSSRQKPFVSTGKRLSLFLFLPTRNV